MRGDEMGAKELMEELKMSKAVYKDISRMVKNGWIVVARRERTRRKPRYIYKLSDSMRDKFIHHEV